MRDQYITRSQFVCLPSLSVALQHRRKNRQHYWSGRRTC